MNHADVLVGNIFDSHTSGCTSICSISWIGEYIPYKKNVVEENSKIEIHRSHNKNIYSLLTSEDLKRMPIVNVLPAAVLPPRSNLFGLRRK